MFSGALNAFKNAASAILVEVAPPPNTSPLDDLKHFWERVKEEHQRLVLASQEDPDTDVRALQDSTIRENLENIVNVLRDEDSGADLRERYQNYVPTSEGDRPCLQYIIKEGVLEVLCAMSLSDHPPGMMSLVLQTIRLMLIHVSEESLLVHISIHRPICHMVHVCIEARKGSDSRGGHGAGGGGVSVRAQASLVALLEEIWRHVAKEPTLLRAFFNYGREGLSPDQAAAFDKKRHHHLLIFAALIPYMHVKRRSGDRARAGLMAAVGIRDRELQHYMLHRSVFCRRVADGLSSAYAALPSTLDSKGDDKDYAAQTALEEFMRRLTFSRDLCIKADEQWAEVVPDQRSGDLNSNISSASGVLGAGLVNALCREIKERFFEDRLGPALMSVSEVAQTAATVYTHTMIQTLCATPKPKNPLLESFVRFLLGDERDPEVSPISLSSKDNEGRSSPSSLSLRTVLIHRITSQAPAVSEVTMELFHCLLEVGGSFALHNLIVRNMVRIKSAEIYGVDGDGKRNTNPTKNFLSFFPNAPTPSDISGERSDTFVFEEYLTDAHKHYVARMAQYWSFSYDLKVGDQGDDESVDWGQSPQKPDQQKRRHSGVSPGTAGNANDTVGAVYEGIFLATMMDKLEFMLDNTVDENLVLTALWSQLAQCPHPQVHNFLFSIGNLQAGVMGHDDSGRTMVSVLMNLWTEAQVRVKRISNGVEMLEQTRSRMGTLSDETDKGGWDDSKAGLLEVDVSSKGFLEAVVLLEEFLKEIAAILCAREQLHMFS
jgi:hypothetical protein|eukprot:Stramenopile-MAST_4_protein_327